LRQAEFADTPLIFVRSSVRAFSAQQLAFSNFALAYTSLDEVV
jgi:hypothetical protein